MSHLGTVICYGLLIKEVTRMVKNEEGKIEHLIWNNESFFN